MLNRVTKKFPSQQINNSLSNGLQILINAKSSAEKLIHDNAIQEVIIKSINTFKDLFAHAVKNSDDWISNEENKRREAIKLKQKERQGTITKKERERLEQLKRDGFCY
jgi:hypothetical protein